MDQDVRSVMIFSAIGCVPTGTNIIRRSYGTAGSMVSCIRVLFQSIFAATFLIELPQWHSAIRGHLSYKATSNGHSCVTKVGLVCIQQSRQREAWIQDRGRTDYGSNPLSIALKENKLIITSPMRLEVNTYIAYTIIFFLYYSN